MMIGSLIFLTIVAVTYRGSAIPVSWIYLWAIVFAAGTLAIFVEPAMRLGITLGLIRE